MCYVYVGVEVVCRYCLVPTQTLFLSLFNSGNYLLFVCETPILIDCMLIPRWALQKPYRSKSTIQATIDAFIFIAHTTPAEHTMHTHTEYTLCHSMLYIAYIHCSLMEHKIHTKSDRDSHSISQIHFCCLHSNYELNAIVAVQNTWNEAEWWFQFRIFGHLHAPTRTNAGNE